VKILGLHHGFSTLQNLPADAQNMMTRKSPYQFVNTKIVFSGTRVGHIPHALLCIIQLSSAESEEGSRKISTLFKCTTVEMMMMMKHTS